MNYRLRHPIRMFRYWLSHTILRHLMRAVVWLRRRVVWSYGTSVDTVCVKQDGTIREYVIRIVPNHMEDAA